MNLQRKTRIRANWEILLKQRQFREEKRVNCDRTVATAAAILLHSICTTKLKGSFSETCASTATRRKKAKGTLRKRCRDQQAGKEEPKGPQLRKTRSHRHQPYWRTTQRR